MTPEHDEMSYKEVRLIQLEKHIGPMIGFSNSPHYRTIKEYMEDAFGIFQVTPPGTDSIDLAVAMGYRNAYNTIISDIEMFTEAAIAAERGTQE